MIPSPRTLAEYKARFPALDHPISTPQTNPTAADEYFASLDRDWNIPRTPVAVCFDPSTPEEIISYVNEHVYNWIPGQRFFTGSRWPGSANNPITLTWSLVPDTVVIPGGNVQGEVTSNSILFARMDALFANQGGRTRWVGLIQQCFDRFAALTGVTYTRITVGGNDWDDGASWGSSGSAGLRGDVRIGSHFLDGSSGVLAYNQFPTNGDMVLDSEENWASSSNNWRFMRNIIQHEHGHGLGIFHVCPITQTKLMEPFLSTSFDGAQHDDIRAVQSLYGDDCEPNNTSGSAFNLGTVNVGAPKTVGPTPSPTVVNGSIVSIVNASDADFYRFTITGPRVASVSVTPVGLNYDSSQQACSGQSGSCCSGNVINSLTMADLNVQIIGTNGSTVLGTAAAQPAGQTETLSGVLLNAAGNYFIRVYPNGAVSQPQAYQFTLTLGQADCNGNGIPDATDIANHTSLDCNLDGIPDECQVAPLCPTCPDCQNDHIPDSCQVPPVCPACPDCNANGVPDSCEPDCNGNGRPDSCDIDLGSSQDCNGDGIPDECQVPPLCPTCADCNGNGVPDDCDLAFGGETDCNHNGILDRCETDPQFCGGSCLADCNDNLLPDSCEVVTTFSSASPFLAPFDSSNPRSNTFFDPPEALGNVSVSITARAQLFQVNQWISVSVNGTPIGSVFLNTGLNCPALGQSESITLTAAQWNGFRTSGGGIVTIQAEASPAVGACDGSFVIVGMSYQTRSNDCNANSVPDTCEITQGSQADCNRNSVPDACEITNGTELDDNSNNIPDSCETPEVVVFFVSPQAEPGKGQTVAEAVTWGHAPVIAAANCSGSQSITLEVWVQINPVGINFLNFGYTDLVSGAFDLAGENNSVKGSSFSLMFTGSPPRRWDASSPVGAAGGSGYVWQGVSFAQGAESGISSQPGRTAPATPDLAPNFWKLGTLTINLPSASSIVGGPDGLFDAFFELAGDWLAGPIQPFASLAFGFDDQGETFPGDVSTQAGRRSSHPDVQIRICTAVPQCNSCAGDVDSNGRVDGNDVAGFVSCMLANPLGSGCPCADFNASGGVDGADMNQFVARMLNDGNLNCHP